MRRDGASRPTDDLRVGRALLLAANHLSLHPFHHHKRTGKAGLMGQAQMSLQMVLRHETGGFTGKFQVRRTAWLAQGGDFRHGEPGKAGAAGFQKCFFCSKVGRSGFRLLLAVWATMSSCSAGVYTCCKMPGGQCPFQSGPHHTGLCQCRKSQQALLFQRGQQGSFSLGRRPSITARSKVFSALPTAGPGVMPASIRLAPFTASWPTV